MHAHIKTLKTFEQQTQEMSLKNLQKAEQMLFHAISFQNAYSILAEHSPFLEIGRSPKRDRKDVSPADVMSIAFSTEIALKAIYQILEIKNNRSHNLKKLFCDLPDIIQTAILEQLRKTAPTHCDPYSLGGQLAAIADAFKKWRYSYEYAALSFYPEFCAELCKCITDVGFHLIYQEVQRYGLMTRAYPARPLGFSLDLREFKI